MSATLCAVHEVSARDPQPFKHLVPSLISILKQVRKYQMPLVMLVLLSGADGPVLLDSHLRLNVNSAQLILVMATAGC